VGGLEPPRPYGQQILSLQRLPFRHTRFLVFYAKPFAVLKGSKLLI
jgi:hypothetical protein